MLSNDFYIVEAKTIYLFAFVVFPFAFIGIFIIIIYRLGFAGIIGIMIPIVAFPLQNWVSKKNG